MQRDSRPAEVMVPGDLYDVIITLRDAAPSALSLTVSAELCSAVQCTVQVGRVSLRESEMEFAKRCLGLYFDIIKCG